MSPGTNKVWTVTVEIEEMGDETEARALLEIERAMWAGGDGRVAARLIRTFTVPGDAPNWSSGRRNPFAD